jgi:hypothetical protein
MSHRTPLVLLLCWLLFRQRTSNEVHDLRRARSEFKKDSSPLLKANHVRTAGKLRIGELSGVVFPKTDRTYFVGTGRHFGQCFESTTRARMHNISLCMGMSQPQSRLKHCSRRSVRGLHCKGVRTWVKGGLLYRRTPRFRETRR